MILQTHLPLKPQETNAISYHSKLLLVGSCFSENIGNKLAYYKFQSLQNPFGILFNPIVIERLIEFAVTQKELTPQNIFHFKEQWHSFDAHSLLSSASDKELLKNLNAAIHLTSEQIKQASHIIITLGTSWVYRFKETEQIVANCHKIPQKQFIKELLSIEDIYQSLKNIDSLIKSVNKAASTIYTVSPVRHLKDGFIENQQSKAHLISAIHKVIKKSTANYYFPSFEIMMDELRDYRFYAEDMIHPNHVAINYIWDKFKYVWISEDTHEIMHEVETIQKGRAHRPFNPTSEQHKIFLDKLKNKENLLQKKLPFISF